jgi:glutamate-1-semialdehyde 2,1-aminomutase
MAAGYATLSQLTKESYGYFQKLGDLLATGISEAAEHYGIEHTINRAGSMIGFFFTNHDVINYETAKLSNLDHFNSCFRTMLQEGISLPPSQFEGLFLSTAHTEADIEKTVAAFRKAFSQLK